ncbi:hypothetical protein [Paractinoplanes lichenicola]|uniref:Uncharacterized protein n=1 Tax=Paractinoplanes lichenicola TaxID=2802976 RepID=A0ABS1VTX1_9ACTN|nr:hypothetical protein [Actinoplanes lichenicola]MBL7257889.1 hypothetical protein [Actinoplanes lichenicola]
MPIRSDLLALAQDDPDVTGAATIRSGILPGEQERWSDDVLIFAVRGPAAPVLTRWTGVLHDRFGVLHSFGIEPGRRLFLLPSGDEVDLAFRPAAEFAPRDHSWRTVFGQAGPLLAAPPADRDRLIGLGWHHCIRARAAIDRGLHWEVVRSIGLVRDQTLALAALRRGQDTDLPLEATLVRSLARREQRRALDEAAGALDRELAMIDVRLGLRELVELTP